jgi:hypothetical protein
MREEFFFDGSDSRRRLSRFWLVSMITTEGDMTA